MMKSPALPTIPVSLNVLQTNLLKVSIVGHFILFSLLHLW